MTYRVKLVPKDFVVQYEWSPREKFPLVPILENSRLTHFTTNYSPLSLSSGKSQPRTRRFPTVQVVCNYRATSGSFWGEIPPYQVQTLLKRCIFGGVLGVEGMV